MPLVKEGWAAAFIVCFVALLSVGGGESVLVCK